MLYRYTFIVSEFILFLYVLDINVTRNGNNLKLKVKSEFSLSMGMLINHSNSYIHSTKVLCDTFSKVPYTMLIRVNNFNLIIFTIDVILL